MYLKTGFSSVRQSFTQLVGGKQEQAKMGFPPPTCVTRDCLTVLELVLEYINHLAKRRTVRLSLHMRPTVVAKI